MAENRDTVRFSDWARHAEQDGPTPAIPAATVVLLRDSSRGLETLMLRKNSKIAFGGMWVFPGGRIDDEDHHGTVDIVETARKAAAREAVEEAGQRVEVNSMVLFSHWLPPKIMPRRYSTWFFAARSGGEAVLIDDGEIILDEWMTPASAIARRDDIEIELAPPTWVTLKMLADFHDVDHALEALAERPVRHYETVISQAGSHVIALWAGDAGYEVADATAPGPRHRLEMTDGGYVYFDDGAPF